MLPTNPLDLGHSGPTSSDTAHPRRRTTTSCRQPGEHQASQERGETEPQECGDRLSFLASLCVIV